MKIVKKKIGSKVAGRDARNRKDQDDRNRKDQDLKKNQK
jgi:hypothetical protein